MRYKKEPLIKIVEENWYSWLKLLEEIGIVAQISGSCQYQQGSEECLQPQPFRLIQCRKLGQHAP